MPLDLAFTLMFLLLAVIFALAAIRNARGARVPRALARYSPTTLAIFALANGALALGTGLRLLHAG